MSTKYLETIPWCKWSNKVGQRSDVEEIFANKPERLNCMDLLNIEDLDVFCGDENENCIDDVNDDNSNARDLSNSSSATKGLHASKWE